MLQTEVEKKIKIKHENEGRKEGRRKSRIMKLA